MGLTVEDKFNASKPFLPNGLTYALSSVIQRAKFDFDTYDVLKEMYSNSYKLMEEMKADVGDDCDPFYEDFPFLMYGNGIHMYHSDQLFLLKQRKAAELPDESILYLPNDEFSEKYIKGDEPELQEGRDFAKKCSMPGSRISVYALYAKDSNSIWLDSKIVQNAIMSILKKTHYPDLNEVSDKELCGMLVFFDGGKGWYDFFEGLPHEFGHYLFKKEYENIGPSNFVNHSDTRAHQLGEKYENSKSYDMDFIRGFFSKIVNSKPLVK